MFSRENKAAPMGIQLALDTLFQREPMADRPSAWSARKGDSAKRRGAKLGSLGRP